MNKTNRTIIIKRIDHSKIKDGQSVDKDGLYDINGKYIGPVPYIKKEFPILEVKILSGDLAEAVDSRHQGTSQKYKKLRDKHFPNCYTMSELMGDWKEKQEKCSDKELLEIFPESKPYLKNRLKILEKQEDKISSSIIRDLKNIHEKKKGFEAWFSKEVIGIWRGSLLDKIDKEIKRLRWMLSPKNKTGSGGMVTQDMIDRAKEYPFKDLIKEVKKDFAVCPFHEDKSPSFYIKNNWGHCFSCNWNGDTIKFLMERESLSFPEAVKKLN